MWLILARVVVGVICLIVGLNLLTRRRMFRGRMLASSGVIVGLDILNEATHSVEVKFTTRNGENRVVKVLTEGLTAGEYKVGEQVTILYDPVNPLEVKLESVAEHWILPLGLMAVGVVLLLSLGWKFL
jgi:Protein of unknown function (DUF3592)